MDNQERSRDALIEHIAEQDRIIRRRIEQIARQAENVREAQNAIEAIGAERDEYRAMHSEQMKTIARLQEDPRPLTADDINDEMLYRGLSAYYDINATQKNWNADRAEDFRRALAAALTEPTRPEGAEGIEADMADWYGENGMPIGGTGDRLADHLAALGYRKAP